MNDTPTLFEKSRQVQAESDALLEESSVVRTLEGYGQVRFTGSYAYHLMVNRDIDIYVINAATSRGGVTEALSTFIRQGFFHGCLYYDFVDFTQERFPYGYYIGLKTPFRGEKWKIDIWFLWQDIPAREPLIQDLRALDEGKRATILEIKRYVAEHELDIASIKIYNAVLREGVSDIHAFLTRL
ncbi:MAG: hypothetical protein M3Z08_15315 [Chloroflexota bacterium]|nr:hypothetical protein [Chloroflexota bacterium]